MVKGLGFVLVFFLAALLYQTFAWSTGAPEWQCSGMSPSPVFHYPFQSENPELYYIIEVNSSTYTPGESVTVTIKALSEDYRFKGFFIQAREQEGEDAAIGEFEEDSLPAKTQIVNCNGGKGGVTHSEPGNHKSLAFTWIPPMSGTSNITFVATIVKERTQYWIKHKSRPISYKPEDCIEEDEIENKTTEKTSGIILEKTGKEEKLQEDNKEKKEKAKKPCKPKVEKQKEEVKKEDTDDCWFCVG